MEFSRYFIHGLFLLAGVFSLLTALMNWDWFFLSPNSQFIVKQLGRGKSRLFYGFIGIIMIAFGVYGFMT